MKTGRKRLTLSLMLLPLIYQLLPIGKPIDHAKITMNRSPSGQVLDTELAALIQGPADLGAAFGDPETRLSARVELVLPTSLQMIDAALTTLSSGWETLDPVEQYYFRLFFDPGNTGEIDQAFVEEVAANYQKIRAEFEGPMTLVLEPASEHCDHERLYYTYFRNVHVCPYFMEDPHPQWMASVFVHEMAHIALKVKDRAYYEPGSEAYESLTPRGSAAAQVPVIGPLFREILRSDTLYHPDAYAWFGSMMLREADRSVSDQASNVGNKEVSKLEAAGSISTGR
jgi:hypothetical protein